MYVFIIHLEKIRKSVLEKRCSPKKYFSQKNQFETHFLIALF